MTTAIEQKEFNTEGCSIINLNFEDGVSTYCCGTPVISGNNIVCPYGYDAFQLNDATALPGYALLANVTSLSGPSSSSTPSSSSAGQTDSAIPAGTSSRMPSETSSSSGATEVAIGAGVGIPLGLIAIASLVWAFWERKRANKLSQALLIAGSNPAPGYGGDPRSRLINGPSEPSELGGGGRSAKELMGREVHKPGEAVLYNS